jgi:hypothetical protein
MPETIYKEKLYKNIYFSNFDLKGTHARDVIVYFLASFNNGLGLGQEFQKFC